MVKTVEFAIRTGKSTSEFKKSSSTKGGTIGHNEDHQWRGPGYKEPIHAANKNIQERTTKSSIEIDDKIKEVENEV